MSNSVREAFRKQADHCRLLSSPMTAAVADALADILGNDTRTGARALAWPGDPLADVLPLRLAGGLHALARSGHDAGLAALYQNRNGDFAGVLARVLSDWDDWLCPWLDNPPQTNEVGRSTALMGGLMIAADRLNLPMELLEIGASAGLNLNLDRFRYNLGGLEIGPADSNVRLKPDWRGEPPQGQWPDIATRVGVDQNPLDIMDDGVSQRLLAYCWPDQQERLERLEAAIQIARSHPLNLESADAADWIEEKLAEPQAEDTARVVMHSVVWQYVPAPSQGRIGAAIERAGCTASTSRPILWLRFEPDPPELGPMQLRLTLWPSGKELHLATCHPHGAAINWFGAENPA